MNDILQKECLAADLIELQARAAYTHGLCNAITGSILSDEKYNRLAEDISECFNELEALIIKLRKKQDTMNSVQKESNHDS